MTYAEKQGIQPFDWRAFLKRAKSGAATSDEIFVANQMARSWVTCACGNQCAAIPRHSSGTPLDMKLWELGYDFWVVIERGDWPKAARTLSKIEARSAELLKELI